VVVPSKPVPVTVTEVPTIPLDTESVMWGSTVNAADASFVPSLATIECVPATEAGTVNPQLNVPVAVVDSEPDVHVETARAEKFKVSAVLGA
jgi:hypothetical protein